MPSFWPIRKPSGKGAIALGKSPSPRLRPSRPKTKPRLNRREYGLLTTDEQEDSRKNTVGVAVNDIDGDEEEDNEDDDDTNSYFADNDTPDRGRSRRRFFMCGMACTLAALVVLLILNVWLFASQSIFSNGSDYDPDAIFAKWGKDGTGTEELSWYPTDFLRDVQPIPCHSHNDYWRKVPLFSALHAGCIGTEADVWLVGNDLHVGHDRTALTPNRTFQSLYVDPLVKILDRANQNTTPGGASTTVRRGVFDRDPNQTLSLLVDVKTEGASTFRKVLEQLEPLHERGYLSTFENGKVTYGPVTVVGSGNTPFEVVVENGTYRYAFFDAPLQSLENSVYNTTNSYYASAALTRGLGLVWFGRFRQAQLEKMREQLDEAHSRGLQSRYWSLPSWPVSVRNAVWTTLVSEGIGLLNVDDIQAASEMDWTSIKWV